MSVYDFVFGMWVGVCGTCLIIWGVYVFVLAVEQIVKNEVDKLGRTKK